MKLCAVTVAIVFAGSASAGVDFSNNLALGGTALLGSAAADDGTFGTFYEQDTNSAGNVIDGDTGDAFATRATTFNGGASNPTFAFDYDFVGVSFAASQDQVAAVKFWNIFFPDGGWFTHSTFTDGDDTGSPGPKIQYSLDGGTTWIDVTGQVDDYAATINAANLPAFTSIETTFTFDAVDGVTDIRILGDGGRRFDPPDQNGFVGASEFEVFAVPTPGSAAVLALAGLVGIRRRR